MDVMRRRFLQRGATLLGGMMVASVLAQLARAAQMITTKMGVLTVPEVIEPIVKTDEEWRQELPKEAYAVLREHGTERAGTSPLNAEKRAGVYVCAGCQLPLFDSAAKYESGTGWPSFFAPLAPQVVGTTVDKKLWMTRTEVHCARCKGHLGHVFEDGPAPTGLRYCMNGVAMQFREK